MKSEEETLKSDVRDQNKCQASASFSGRKGKGEGLICQLDKKGFLACGKQAKKREKPQIILPIKPAK